MLLAHSTLSEEYLTHLETDIYEELTQCTFTDGQAVALTAIRTCYSHLKPSEILNTEYNRYFNQKASDGEGGTEADRLTRQIFNSKHTSTLEHITFTFAIEGVSRALLAQLTRHRVGFSFSVQSQRYVKFGSNDRSEGFEYHTPNSIKGKFFVDSDGYIQTIEGKYQNTMEKLQEVYDELREMGVPAEDARMILPNAATCNLTMTVNLRSLLDFYSKRKAGRGAQSEITVLAKLLRAKVEGVEPFTQQFFERV